MINENLHVDSPLQIESIIHNLSRMIRSLHRLGSLALIMTIVTIGTTLAFIVVIDASNKEDIYFNRYIATTFLLVIAGLSIAILMYYDSIQKRGDVYFAEISDELQWYVDIFEQKFPEEPRLGRPPLNYRITLREYAGTTGLPLIKGKNGALIYTLVNLIFVVLYVVVLSFSG